MKNKTDVQEMLIHDINRMLQQEDMWQWDKEISLPKYMEEWIQQGVTTDQRIVINRYVLEQGFGGDLERRTHLYIKPQSEDVYPLEEYAVPGGFPDYSGKKQNYVSYQKKKRLRSWWTVAFLYGLLMCIILAMWPLGKKIPSFNYPEVIRLSYAAKQEQTSSQDHQWQARIVGEEIVVEGKQAQLIKLKPQLQNVESIALSTKGKYLAEFSGDNWVAMWDVSKQQQLATPWRLRGVYCNSDLSSIIAQEERIWAVGEGTILSSKDSGKSWFFHEMAKDYRLNGLYEKQGALWAVGDNGVILHSPDGENWDLQEIRSSVDLNDICGTQDKLWIAGTQGTVFLREGDKSWKPFPTPLQTDLYAITCSNNGEHIWVGGKGGEIYFHDGKNWQLPYKNTGDIFDIEWDEEGKRIYCCGSEGISIYSLDSEKIDHYPVSKALRKIVREGQRLWCVGEGIFLYSDDGGDNWILQIIGENELLMGMSYNRGELWLCGNRSSSTQQQKILAEALPLFPKLHLEYIGPQEIELGENAVYTVKIKNSGKTKAQELVLRYIYSTEGLLIKESSQQFSESLLHLEDIAPGEEQLLTITLEGREIGEWASTVRLLKSEEILQSVTINTRVSSSIPAGWPVLLWKECWNEQEGYVDFSIDSWGKLKHEEQVQLARAYQEWYAREKNLELTKVEKKLGVEFVFKLIPPGKFWMGSPETEKERFENEKRHKVIISKAFWIGETEVTQGQWQAVMGENPARFKEVGLNGPVESVSWDDCRKFCEKTGWKMPTEAQWEYACRAGTIAPFNLGENISAKNVNYDGNYPYSGREKGIYREKTTVVKSLANENSWGCYDFHGNVYEWCQDWFDEKYYERFLEVDAKDPLGPKEGSDRVLRGGDWGGNARRCRSAYRGGADPAATIFDADTGFRVLLSSSE